MSTDALTKDLWQARLGPALARSLEEANREMTDEPAVQAWLQTASFEAAMGLEAADDMTATTMAYSRMLDELEARFAPLREAVREMTGGCGRLALDWRPLSPQFSRLYIDFGTDYEPQGFYALAALTREEARSALARFAALLPQGRPFPGRPHEATGMAAYDGRCAGVRLFAHAAGPGALRRTVTLLPRGYRPLADLSEADAADALLQALRLDPPAPPTPISPAR